MLKKQSSRTTSIAQLAMPRQRSKKLSERRKALQQPTPLTQDERQQNDSDNDVDVMEKDEDEHELDRLVLGDEAGFMAQLGHEDSGDEDDDLEEAGLEAEIGLHDVEENLEGVDDAEVGSCLCHCNMCAY